ncbi:MAG: biotin--[acetyl-CoA-carboxylase] ligase [Spirochaetales bacterium]|nr:biotin--[acetyl-CoA-carboxylase] ligase [Spirochaetales bacterium]
MLEELTPCSPVNDAPVYFKPIVVSTMDEAAALADAGAPAGTVIMTDFQEQGRGRRSSRGWEAAPGESLLFTVLMPRGEGPAALLKAPLVAGLAVATALESLYSLPVAVKWPNDVLVRGKKICGILCVAHPPFVLAGIGINCRQTQFSTEVAGRATSLALELGRPIDRRRILYAVLAAIDRALVSPTWREDIESRLAFRGERRRLVLGEGKNERAVEGIVAGLGENGEIVLATDEKPEGERFFSGSLS